MPRAELGMRIFSRPDMIAWLRTFAADCDNPEIAELALNAADTIEQAERERVAAERAVMIESNIEKPIVCDKVES
jgi:hypothetical protein